MIQTAVSQFCVTINELPHLHIVATRSQFIPKTSQLLKEEEEHISQTKLKINNLALRAYFSITKPSAINVIIMNSSNLWCNVCDLTSNNFEHFNLCRVKTSIEIILHF